MEREYFLQLVDEQNNPIGVIEKMAAAIQQNMNIPFLLNLTNHYLHVIIRTYIASHHPNKKTDFYNYKLLIFPKIKF